jgi:hypothetical protein
MAAMSIPDEPTAPPPEPGERRLARPPGERYASRADDAAQADRGAAGRGASPARGVAFAALAGVVTAAGTVLLGGVLGISAGLLVWAGVGGWATGLGGPAGAGAAVPASTRAWLAAAIAAAGVGLGQVGLWLYARSEGGVLSLPDYLGQTFGFLVPLQFAIAIAIAWWSAR